MQSKPSYKLALITGGTSGLGKALTEFLQSKGIETLSFGRSEIDLSNPSERQKLLSTITEKTPDLIINNAGFGLYGETVNLSIEEQRKMIEVNVNALVEISIHSAKHLIQMNKKGTILNISSAAAFFPFPLFNTYSSSKAFVNQFSQGLDSELKDKGIRVLCACPGQIATNFRLHAAKGNPQKQDRRTMSTDTAVRHLWKQIEKQKQLYIFDWKTRLLVAIAKILPKKTLERLLKKSISSRLPSSSSRDT